MKAMITKTTNKFSMRSLRIPIVGIGGQTKRIGNKRNERRPNGFLKTLLLLFVCSLNGASGDQPNIVFIIADDLGWNDVGFHGGNCPTPNLDRLATEGMELTQHYVAPVCSPTRVGFLTGRYWSRFGVTTPTNTLALPAETVTLPNALRDCGYETCLIGKWHLGSKAEWGPNHYGFDHSYGSLAGGVTAYSHRYKKGLYSKTWHRNCKLIEEEGHVTDLLTAEAEMWIAKRSNRPFFLYVPFTAVHLPVNEPKVWLEKVPKSIESEIGRQYAACIMHLDDAVGRILKALDRKGIRENTLVVFTSDNGGSTATNNTQPYPKDDSPPGKLTASNSPLRGQKGSVYEGGTRVPTLVSWPGKIDSRKESTPVVIADWMPTFSKFAGFKPQNDLRWDGTDLSMLLTKGTPIAQRAIYVAGPRWRSMSIREGDWKLVVTEKHPAELFNIAKDPAEKQDMANSRPERVTLLQASLQKMRRADNDSKVR